MYVRRVGTVMPAVLWTPPDRRVMRIRNRFIALVVGLSLAAGPVQALRQGPVGDFPVAVQSTTGDASRGWFAEGLGGIWSWLQSLFDEDHGGIVPKA